MPPGQSAFRSPGTLRSRCLDHRQLGQWLRWDVLGASSETSTPQWPHTNERGNGKSGDLSGQGFGAGQTFRLLSFTASSAAGPGGPAATTIVGSGEPSVKQISVGTSCRSLAGWVARGSRPGGAGVLGVDGWGAGPALLARWGVGGWGGGRWRWRAGCGWLGGRAGVPNLAGVDGRREPARRAAGWLAARLRALSGLGRRMCQRGGDDRDPGARPGGSHGRRRAGRPGRAEAAVRAGAAGRGAGPGGVRRPADRGPVRRRTAAACARGAAGVRIASAPRAGTGPAAASRRAGPCHLAARVCATAAPRRGGRMGVRGPGEPGRRAGRPRCRAGTAVRGTGVLARSSLPGVRRPGLGGSRSLPAGGVAPDRDGAAGRGGAAAGPRRPGDRGPEPPDRRAPAARGGVAAARAGALPVRAPGRCARRAPPGPGPAGR
jgi:hypothetical protein